MYGLANYVKFNDMRLYMAQSKTQKDPPFNSIHYLVKPDLLLIPEFTLYENFRPSSIEVLLENLSSICDVCGVGIGMGYKRIAKS